MPDFVVENVYLPLTGLRMEVLSSGRGPLMIFLHGFPEMALSWRRQLEYFGSHGFLAAAPNMRGYGATDRPAKGYDPDTLADDVLALINYYGEKSAIIVGHDWGGVVAWHFAYRYPAATRALIILNAPHPVLFSEILRGSRAQRKKSFYMALFQIPRVPEWYLGRNGAKPIADGIYKSAVRKEAFTNEILDQYSRNMAKPGALWAGLEYYREARRHSRRLWNFYRGKKIAAPTLVVWAMQDQFLGPELAEGLDRFIEKGNIEVVRIENCGHWVQQEAATEVNDAIESFLTNIYGYRTLKCALPIDEKFQENIRKRST